MRGNTKIKKALYDLWFKHYTTATNAERVKLAETLINGLLRDYDITKYKTKHPAYYHKESDVKFKLFTVAEIIADFIIRAEEDDSRLTKSPQTANNRENQRNIKEVLTDFTDLLDDDDELESQEKLAGLQMEYNVYKARPDLYPDHTEPAEPELTVEEFKEMIERVKANAKEYAAIYSGKYRKDYKDTIRRIRQLDVERVAICEECGGVYYRHDLRRKYCDLQDICGISAKKRRDNLRYLTERSIKVKYRAE